MSWYKQIILRFCHPLVHECGKIRWTSWLGGSVPFDWKQEIFHSCNQHEYTNIMHYRDMKFLCPRFLLQHMKHPLYIHEIWNPAYEDSSITHFCWTKLCFLKKYWKTVQTGFGCNIFKVEKKDENTETYLGVVTWVGLNLNSNKF